MTTDAILIRRLAEQLAFFQNTRRDGRMHIGPDMKYCLGLRAFHRPCSPRCEAVRQVLADAATHLHTTVDELRTSEARRSKTTAPAPQPALPLGEDK